MSITTWILVALVALLSGACGWLYLLFRVTVTRCAAAEVIRDTVGRRDWAQRVENERLNQRILGLSGELRQAHATVQRMADHIQYAQEIRDCTHRELAQLGYRVRPDGTLERVS